MCSRGCSRAILFIFNFLFFLCGTLLLAFGILGVANPTALTNFLSSIPGVTNMSQVIDIPTVIQSSSVFMIILGCVMVVFGFLGCAGAACDHHGLLFFYWFLLILVLIAEVALIIFVAVKPGMAEEKVQDLLYKSLVKDFNPVSINNQTVTLPSTLGAVSWVSVQFEVPCCGAYNSSDYGRFKWNNTFMLPNGAGGGKEIDALYPPSCCVMTTKSVVPQTTHDFVNLEGCLNGVNGTYHTAGCYMAVNDLARMYSYIPIIICVVVILIELVAIMAAIQLWRSREERDR